MPTPGTDDLLRHLTGLGMSPERSRAVLSELGPDLAWAFVQQVRRQDLFDHPRRHRRTVPIVDVILHRFRLARAMGG